MNRVTEETMEREIHLEFEELAHRENHGIAVSLAWSRETDELVVLVSDATAGESFALIPARHEALDVFNHPFAYAGARPALPLVVP